MINLLSCFQRRDHPIRLNSEFHLDLQWWDEFLSSWHGVSFWLFPGMAASSDVEVTSDAAGSGLGFGAYFRSEWLVVRGPRARLGVPSPIKNCSP